MSVRKWVVASMLWLATVAGASSLTWLVISSVGTRLGQPVVVASADADQPTTGAGHATKTWSGRAGKLTATCNGESIAVESAVPSVGFWVKVYDQGPERLRVDFEATGGGDDDSRETRIVATCVDGSPVFLRA